MPRYPEKRRAALEATMQAEVHRVATEILREEGLEALTMDRIARDIGVSRGTLYNYFADADAVVSFVEARTFEPLGEQFDEILASSLPPEEKLAAIMTQIFDSIYDDRALAMALFAKQKIQGPRAEQKIAHRNHLLRVARTIIDDGATSGRFRPVDADLAAELFLGLLIGPIDSMMYSGEFKPAHEFVPEMVDLLLGGLALRPEPNQNPRSPGEPTSS